MSLTQTAQRRSRRTFVAALIGTMALSVALSLGGVVYAQVNGSACNKTNVHLVQTTKDRSQTIHVDISTVHPGGTLKMGYGVTELRYVAAVDSTPRGANVMILFLNPATGTPVHTYSARDEPIDVAVFAHPGDRLPVRARFELDGCASAEKDLGYVQVFPQPSHGP
jgi:hypothetical protein